MWITGDTVLCPGVRQVAERFAIGTTVLHLGAVRFGRTGPVRYTMTAVERAFATAPTPVRESLHWLTPGTPAAVTL